MAVKISNFKRTSYKKNFIRETANLNTESFAKLNSFDRKYYFQNTVTFSLHSNYMYVE